MRNQSRYVRRERMAVITEEWWFWLLVFWAILLGLCALSWSCQASPRGMVRSIFCCCCRWCAKDHDNDTDEDVIARPNRNVRHNSERRGRELPQDPPKPQLILLR